MPISYSLRVALATGAVCVAHTALLTGRVVAQPTRIVSTTPSSASTRSGLDSSRPERRTSRSEASPPWGIAALPAPERLGDDSVGRHRGSHVLRGAAIGLGVGVVTGAGIVMMARCGEFKDPINDTCLDVGSAAALGAVVGGLAGTLVGAGIGALAERAMPRRRPEVPGVGRVRFTVVPGPVWGRRRALVAFGATLGGRP